MDFLSIVLLAFIVILAILLVILVCVFIFVLWTMLKPWLNR